MKTRPRPQRYYRFIERDGRVEFHISEDEQAVIDGTAMEQGMEKDSPCYEVWRDGLQTRIKAYGWKEPTVNDWVKRLGQWHLSYSGAYVTICGSPMLGNDYTKVIPEAERERCPKCHGLGEEKL